MRGFQLFVSLLCAGAGLVTALAFAHRQGKNRALPPGERYLLFIALVLGIQSAAAWLLVRHFGPLTPALPAIKILAGMSVWLMLYSYASLATGGAARSWKRAIQWVAPFLAAAAVLLVDVPEMNRPNPRQKPQFDRAGVFASAETGFQRPPVQAILDNGQDGPKGPWLKESWKFAVQSPVDGFAPGRMRFPGRRAFGMVTWIVGGFLLFGWVYLVMTGVRVGRYIGDQSTRFINGEKKKLIWLVILVAVVGVAHILNTLFFGLGALARGPAAGFFIFFDIPVFLLYIITIGSYLFFFKGPPLEEGKYGKNSLSPAKVEEYYRVLAGYLRDRKSYCDESLTLQKTAEALDIHANDLSQVVNRKQGCNFRDFINSFRVEEVKRGLTDPQNRHKNILAIAYDSGFNSKSSFNLVFKKHTHMTPSQYLKKYCKG